MKQPHTLLPLLVAFLTTGAASFAQGLERPSSEVAFRVCLAGESVEAFAYTVAESGQIEMLGEQAGFGFRTEGADTIVLEGIVLRFSGGFGTFWVGEEVESQPCADVSAAVEQLISDPSFPFPARLELERALAETLARLAVTSTRVSELEREELHRELDALSDEEDEQPEGLEECLTRNRAAEIQIETLERDLNAALARLAAEQNVRLSAEAACRDSD